METPASIALASTASQYLTWFATFIPFHVRDNIDLYYTGVNLRYGTLLKDITAMTLGCGALDAVYLCARPTLTYALQHQGFGATGASLLADIICIPAYVLASLPLVQGMGVIRTESKT